MKITYNEIDGIRYRHKTPDWWLEGLKQPKSWDWRKHGLTPCEAKRKI